MKGWIGRLSLRYKLTQLLRGGMGTGMPYWGPIFTDEQLWALVGYLWTFQFQEANQP